MSSIDLDTEANLAAVALTRLAIQHRDIAGGSVMDAITPYLGKYTVAEKARSGFESVDITPAITRLLANLSQLAGASFEAYVTEKSGGVKPTIEELTDRLAQFEVSFLASGGEPGGGPDERG